MAACRRGIGAAAVAAVWAIHLGSSAVQAAGPEKISVTVFDARSVPYKALGWPVAGGDVIVFSQMPPKPTNGELGSVKAAPVPQREIIQPLAPAELQVTVDAHDQAIPAPAKQYAEGIYAINTDYLFSYPRNAYRLLSAPARFERADWITAALVAGAGGALLLLDEPLMDFWQNNVKSDTTNDGAEVFREFGDSTNIIIGSLAAYALAETLDSAGAVDARREKSVALLSLQSFLLTEGIITGAKFLTGRNRPADAGDAFDFEGPAKGDTNASFPSGHAGSAFAVASVLAETYGYDNPWVPWVAYGMAGSVALSRVNDNRHWFSDVFIASALGYFVGTTITRHSPFLKRNNITLLPFSKDDAHGVGLRLKF